jgi:hypothetical protein
MGEIYTVARFGRFLAAFAPFFVSETRLFPVVEMPAALPGRRVRADPGQVIGS